MRIMELLHGTNRGKPSFLKSQIVINQRDYINQTSTVMKIS